MKEEKKVKRALSNKQISTLRLIYKYRFITTEILAQSEGKTNGTFARSRLTILHEGGYIGRNFDKGYRLRGEPATYYLLPPGMRALKGIADINQQVIKTLYNDKTASKQFIKHSLIVANLAHQLRVTFGDNLQLFTKSELINYDYFPQPLPDGYISFENNDDHYFLDIYHEATPMFANVQKMKRYVDYENSGEWDTTDSTFPIVFVFCETKKLEDRLKKRHDRIIEETDAPVKFQFINLETNTSFSL